MGAVSPRLFEPTNKLFPATCPSGVKNSTTSIEPAGAEAGDRHVEDGQRLVAHLDAGGSDGRQVSPQERTTEGVEVYRSGLSPTAAHGCLDADIHVGDIEGAGYAERWQVEDAEVAVIGMQPACVAGNRVQGDDGLG